MSFSSGLSGIQAASDELSITGNNIANAGTTGFKMSRAEFSDVYAASSLGTGSLTIGDGTRLVNVSQQFTQGNIISTENNLDMAINGDGFFSLNDGGEVLYSRSGAFGVDRDGYIVNAGGARLRGFQADYTLDPSGVITGAKGDLQISTSNISPAPTRIINAGINLDPSANEPATKFSTGFDESNPPLATSYNAPVSIGVFDNLGIEHLMTMYYVKTPVNNQWQVFVDVDGVDVTPTPTSARPKPFTIAFTPTGQLIANDPNQPPTITAAASTTSTAGALVNTGGLGSLDASDLTINGTTIPAAIAGDDLVSSIDNAQSAIAIKAAIDNASIPGLSASVNTTNVNAGNYTPPTVPTTPYAANALEINGIDMSTIDGGSGAGVFDTPAVMAAGISNIAGLSAVANGNAITITAADGRNIQMETNGLVPSGASFTNFSLGSSANKVQRAAITLTASGANPITIGGNSPLDAGFIIGTSFATTTYTNSDVINIPSITTSDGTTIEEMTIDLTGSTQFKPNSSGGGNSDSDDVIVNELTQNGYPTGRLSGIDVDSTGIISARFSNGRSRAVGQVLLARFANSQGLQNLGGSLFTETFASGSALEGGAGSSSLGLLQGGALEGSNVDLTSELVKLITSQRAFQANTQMIRTQDTVTQSIINIR